MALVKTAAGFALLLLPPAAAWAAQDQQVGARTKAMGGSYTAFEDDPVSVWLNPAGIATQPDGLGVAYQSYTLYEFAIDPITSTLVGTDGEPGWNSPAIIPSYLGAVFQLGSEGNQALGICFTTPFRASFFWQSQQSTVIPLLEDQVFYRLRVAYARDFRFSPEGFFTHLAVGAGLDLSVTEWMHQEIKDLGTGTATLTLSGTDLGFGAGAGILVGLYDNTRDFKVNFGAAWQSQVSYRFTLDQSMVPLFDWPNQFQGGLTFYLLEGLPLRVTVDVQYNEWSKATAPSAVLGRAGFQDSISYSFGVEYRIPVGGGVSLYPRGGFRILDAPWRDPANLPAVGNSVLDIVTQSGRFYIGSAGFGVGWATEGGKQRSIDIAGDYGGDAPGFALSYNMEF
jgi:hypothetical protein